MPSVVILNAAAPLVGSARCFDNNLALFLPRSAKLKLGELGSTKRVVFEEGFARKKGLGRVQGVGGKGGVGG
jgi:hypothetical protein